MSVNGSINSPLKIAQAEEKVELKWLALREIRTDDGTQVRASLDRATVQHYARLYEEGVNMPPLIIFQEYPVFWLADGFHRLAAIELAGFADARCEVRKGTKRDALLFALGANSTHGLPLSKSDRTRVIEMILCDPEWSKWSNSAIAKYVGVTRAYIFQLRKKLIEPSSEPIVRIGVDGRTRHFTPRQTAPPSFTQPNGDYHVAADYESNWLYYLVRFSATQFIEWRVIVNGRTDKGVLAEAVGIVMREKKTTVILLKAAGTAKTVCWRFDNGWLLYWWEDKNNPSISIGLAIHSRIYQPNRPLNRTRSTSHTLNLGNAPDN